MEVFCRFKVRLLVGKTVWHNCVRDGLWHTSLDDNVVVLSGIQKWWPTWMAGPSFEHSHDNNNGRTIFMATVDLLMCAAAINVINNSQVYYLYLSLNSFQLFSVSRTLFCEKNQWVRQSEKESSSKQTRFPLRGKTTIIIIITQRIRSWP